MQIGQKSRLSRKVLTHKLDLIHGIRSDGNYNKFLNLVTEILDSGIDRFTPTYTDALSNNRCNLINLEEGGLGEYPLQDNIF